MALDPPTMLTLSIALAAAAALYLAIEWRNVREPSLLFWSAGFSTIAVGSTLALLRMGGFPLLGIWFANGLLVTAHWLFLLGVARFTEARLSRAWYLIFVAWTAMLLLPEGQAWSKVMLLANSLLVALPTLRASALLRPHGKSLSVGAGQLRYVLLLHGLFYLAKPLTALVPGTLIDLTAFRGAIIQVSLVEGTMAIMLIALSMTGTERYRREKRMARLAARDPLTALYNRRALEVRAPRLLEEVCSARPGALLLIDIDNFKLVNDLHGHIAGDRLLVMLSEMIRALLPGGRARGPAGRRRVRHPARRRDRRACRGVGQRAARAVPPGRRAGLRHTRGGDPEHRRQPVRPAAGQPGDADRAGRRGAVRIQARRARQHPPGGRRRGVGHAETLFVGWVELAKPMRPW